MGRRVVVIGGGMTAVDAAVQSRLLGAEQVTMVYRRGPSALSASEYEQHWAQTHGVTIRCWARPLAVEASGGVLRGMRFAATRLEGSQLVDTGEQFFIEADLVLRAIGQAYGDETGEAAGAAIALEGGRIRTDAQFRTSLPRVWAGGDCRAGGRDLTVEAVEHGKRAAESIHAALTQELAHG